MNAVKLLAIAAVTVAVTLLCIRSGQAMAKTSGSPAGAASVRPSDGKPEAATGPRRFPAITANEHAAAKPDVDVTPSGVKRTAQHRPDGPVKNATRSPPASEAMSGTVPAPAVGQRTNGSSDGQAGGRSLGGGGGTTFGQHAVGQRPVAMASGSREPLVAGKLRMDAYPVDHRNDGGEDGDDVDAKVLVDTGIYRVDNRPNDGKTYRQTTGHRTTMDADVSAVAEEDGSAGYRNSYDLTYSAGGGHQPSTYNPVHGRVPYYGPAAVPSSPAFPYPPQPPPPYTAPGYGRPTRPQRYYGPPQMSHHIAVQQPYYGGQTEHLSVNSNLQHVQMIYDKIDWQKLGILALFKVGLAKLKAFGFLKILFLLVFKLKMFLIAVFFKFLLIAKLIKLAKLLAVPLILLSLMPLMSTLASPMLVGGLLSIPQRILEYLTTPVYAPAAAAAAATKYSAVAADPAAVGTSSAKDTGGDPGGSSASSGSSSSSSSKPEETYPGTPQVRRRLDSPKMIDLSLNVFRKVLDSEKCVERIACRMAVVEKVGILPVWINWVLHRVSKYISNEKLETYLKTYDDVNDELYSKMETTDNWAKWCFDRYDCNNINNITNYRLLNVTDPKT